MQESFERELDLLSGLDEMGFYDEARVPDRFDSALGSYLVTGSKKLIDLRPYNEVSFLGHKAPIEAPLATWTDLTHFRSKLSREDNQLFGRLFLESERYTNLVFKLQNFFELLADLPVICLAQSIGRSEMLRNGLMVSQKNYAEQKLYLFVRPSIDETGLDELIKRIKNVCH